MTKALKAHRYNLNTKCNLLDYSPRQKKYYVGKKFLLNQSKITLVSTAQIWIGNVYYS